MADSEADHAIRTKAIPHAMSTMLASETPH